MASAVELTAGGEFRAPGEHHTFNGSGLRIRRTGVRKLAGFWGHCWAIGGFPQRARVRLYRLPASS